MSFEYFIAGRYFRAKRKQSFISLITLLSVAGVAVGVMALVVVIAVMTGAESDFRNRILGFQSHMSVMRHGGGFSDYKAAADIIEETEGVVAASPFVYSQVMIRSTYAVSGAVLRGIDPDTSVEIIKGYDREKLLKKIPSTAVPPLSKGRAAASAAEPGIILGSELATSIGVGVGDHVYVISPKGMISPVGHVPSMRKFRVTGEFNSGMLEYDGTFAYTNVDSARKLLRMGETVTGIDVWVNDMYGVGSVRAAVLGKLGVSYWARDWMQMNASLFSALKLEKTAMFVILILIVLVAAFNIASSLIMLVMEKTKDVAILKAMGATDRSILKIFVLQGTIIGSLGTSIGVTLGLILCYVLKNYEFIELPKIYAFSTLPVQLEMVDVAVIAVSAMVICFLATLYPAYQASKLNPVEAIRYG